MREMGQSRQHMGNDENQMIKLYVQQLQHVVQRDHDLTRRIKRVIITKGHREYYKSHKEAQLTCGWREFTFTAYIESIMSAKYIYNLDNE